MNTPLLDSRLARLRTIARVLDSAITVPGTSYKFGLDPILGLIPGLGDLAGAALSGYIVLAGIQLGVSRAAVVRMLLNIAVDALVGAVPILGDLFDAGWKANNRNVALIEGHIAAPGASRSSSRLLVAGTVVVLLVFAAAGLIVTTLAVRYLLQLAH